MHIIVIGIPLTLLGIIMLYLMFHWRIIANADSIIIVHNFRNKQKIALTLIDEVILRKEIMTNLVEGEGIYIYIKGDKQKKVANIDQTYGGYGAFKEFLIKNNVMIKRS